MFYKLKNSFNLLGRLVCTQIRADEIDKFLQRYNLPKLTQETNLKVSVHSEKFTHLSANKGSSNMSYTHCMLSDSQNIKSDLPEFLPKTEQQEALLSCFFRTSTASKNTNCKKITNQIPHKLKTKILHTSCIITNWGLVLKCKHSFI